MISFIKAMNKLLRFTFFGIIKYSVMLMFVAYVGVSCVDSHRGQKNKTNSDHISLLIDEVSDSTGTYYYGNGNIQLKYNKWKGKLFGNQYYYHDNGELSKFYFIDLEGNKTFQVEYNLSGNEIERVGNSIYRLYNKDSLLRGEEFTAIVYCSIPVNDTYEFFFEVDDELEHLFLEEEYNAHVQRCKYTFDSVGHHDVTFFLKTYHNDKVIIDSVYLDVFVGGIPN